MAAPACRFCGCTDADCSGCVVRTGSPCRWLSGHGDVCTACVDDLNDELSSAAAVEALHAGRGPFAGCFTSAAGAVALVDNFPHALADELVVEDLVVSEIMLAGLDEMLPEDRR